jgi:diaminohydroxyphosphoribosylaminopyrimidine deaminase/5-amino-6-(5-phosphoribosylamino)uracil reductase
MNRYMEKAIELARTSRCRHKHGCVVVKNGRIIATATNKKVGDPSVEWRLAMHAEFAAVVAAGSQAAGATVYVARVQADGSTGLSKPCKKCESMMKRSGIAKVVWT